MSGALDWTALDRALDEAPEPPSLWLRDDDAVAPTPALDRLFALTEAHGIVPGLAVIPDRLTDALAPWLADRAARALVHGWRHDNHAPPGEKKAEFGAHRPVRTRAEEAAAGLVRLRDAFGEQALPVFTPPWNRIADDLNPALAAAGFRALSTFRPRPAPEAAPGLERLNTHWDPIDWPGLRAGGAALRPAQGMVDGLARLIVDRTRGAADPGEPLGLLTHHLIHDESVWLFLEALFARLSGRARWVDLAERPALR